MYGGGYLKKVLYSGYYLTKGLYMSIIDALQDLIKNCGLIAYNTPELDLVGYETRLVIKAKYIDQAGLTADIGLLNEPLTYLDADTLLDVVSSTDGAGLFTFPSAKVSNIKIPSDGSVFYLQEGLGDTIADSINGRIVKLSADATFTDVNNILSQADQVGYSLQADNKYYWNETFTDLVDNNVVVANQENGFSTAWENIITTESFYEPTTVQAYDGTGENGIDIETATVSTIYGLYDDLVATYPTFVTKDVIGLDESGLFNVNRYTFDFASATEVIVASANIHGRGVDGDPPSVTIFLYEFLKRMCEDNGEDGKLSLIKNNFKLVTIPIANPWGYDNANRRNFNNVDLNRNFDWMWTESTDPSKGSAPFSELESQYIRDTILDNQPNVKGFFDFHSMMNLTNPMKFTIFCVADGIADRVCLDVLEDITATTGYPNDVNNIDTAPFAFAWADNVLNIPSATTELVVYPTDITPHNSSILMTYGVKLFGSALTRMAKNVLVGKNRAIPQYKNRAKYNFKVVAGVIDQGVDNSNWNTSTPDYTTINPTNIEMEASGGTVRADIPTGITETSTQYTVVINVLGTIASGTFGLASSGISGFTAFDGTTLGEQRRLITTDATIVSDELQFFTNSSVPVGEIILFELVDAYKGDFTGGEPLPDGTWESGAEGFYPFYSEMFISDINNIIYEPNGNSKILTYDDMVNINLQQQFVSEDKQQILWYAEPIVRHSECDTKTRKFLDMNEQFFVQTTEGSGEYEPYLVDDGTGKFVPFNVLKNWVEVIE